MTIPSDNLTSRPLLSDPASPSLEAREASVRFRHSVLALLTAFSHSKLSFLNDFALSPYSV